MAQAQCVFLMVLFSAVLCSVSCVKIFPLDGTSVTLARGFNVKPSTVVPQYFTSVNSAVKPSLPPQIPTTSVSKTEIPTLARPQSAPAVAETKPYTIIPITLTITPTQLLTGIRIQPSTTVAVVSTTEGMTGVIAPTNVVKTSATTTFDVPAVDLLPPKVIEKPQNLIQDS